MSAVPMNDPSWKDSFLVSTSADASYLLPNCAVKGQMLRELLTESRDFGTLLGGGGAAGSGTLAAYVPSLDDRKQLFEAVAYECQV